MAYEPLPAVPDHTALEREILDWWDREGIFDKLREQNSGGERFGFLDGPITANNPMGVHHAWGRTLKDVFQRYKALRGFDQRYQNGFDCQGLWVEVEVEKALGLNSKRDIEEYGLAEFAARCRERVAEFAEVITEQGPAPRPLDGLGQRLLHLLGHEHRVHLAVPEGRPRARLALQRPPLDTVVPRCGTSLSQHEQAGEENYAELEHPSLYVRFPLKGREGESLVVWTTTPWTLPANVAAAVKPDAEYGLRDGHWMLAEEKGEYDHVTRGEELVGLEYEGPYDAMPAAVKEHRVIPWDEVSLTEGTGIVHIAPGAGTEDFELGRLHGLPVVVPIDESGRMLPGFGLLEGLRPTRSRTSCSRISASASCSSSPAGSRTATRSAGAARRRSCSASSTTGSSPARRSGRSSSTRTRRSSGRRPSTRSGWTTGCATWATGTSRASGTSGSRCPSIRASAAS